MEEKELSDKCKECNIKMKELEIIENLEIAELSGLTTAQDIVLYQLIHSYNGDRFNEFVDRYLEIKRRF